MTTWRPQHNTWPAAQAALHCLLELEPLDLCGDRWRAPSCQCPPAPAQAQPAQWQHCSTPAVLQHSTTAQLSSTRTTAAQWQHYSTPAQLPPQLGIDIRSHPWSGNRWENPAPPPRTHFSAFQCLSSHWKRVTQFLKLLVSQTNDQFGDRQRN